MLGITLAPLRSHIDVSPHFNPTEKDELSKRMLLFYPLECGNLDDMAPMYNQYVPPMKREVNILTIIV